MYRYKAINYEKLKYAENMLTKMSQPLFKENAKLIYDVLKKRDLLNFILCHKNSVKFQIKDGLTENEEVKNLIQLVYKNEILSFPYFPIISKKEFDNSYIAEIPMTYILNKVDNAKKNILALEIIKYGTALEKILVLKTNTFDHLTEQMLIDSLCVNSFNAGLALIFNVGDFYKNYYQFKNMQPCEEKKMIENLTQAIYGLRLDQIDKLYEKNILIKKLSFPNDEQKVKESIKHYEELIIKNNQEIEF